MRERDNCLTRQLLPYYVHHWFIENEHYSLGIPSRPKMRPKERAQLRTNTAKTETVQSSKMASETWSAQEVLMLSLARL